MYMYCALICMSLLQVDGYQYAWAVITSYLFYFILNILFRTVAITIPNCDITKSFTYVDLDRLLIKQTDCHYVLC